MISFLHRRHLVAALGFIFVFVAALLSAAPGHAQTPTPGLEWTRPIPVSGALAGSRNPVIVAEDDGTVFLIWGLQQADEGSTLFVSKNDGSAWSRPVDVLIGGPRSIGLLDGRGLIQLMFQGGDNVTLTTAPVQDAITARGWNTGFAINSASGAALGDMLMDENATIYAGWFQKVSACDTCYSIAFERFSDSSSTGQGTHAVADLEKSVLQDMQLVRAPSGTLYLAWDVAAGPDTKAGIGLSVSTTNGDTWLDTPHHVSFSEQDINQPHLFLDKNNQLVLVYNYGVRDEVYYSTSTDDGATWTQPQAIPGLFASKVSADDNYFASITDTSGITHLISAGRASKNQPQPGLYHVAWDGTKWSDFQEIYHANTTVEYPAVTLSNGNRLQVSFSTRDLNPVNATLNQTGQVWYTSAQTNAPAATRVPLPTFTPIPTATLTPAATPTIAVTPTPTLAPPDANEDAPDPSSVNTQLPLILALALVVGLLIAVIVVNTVLRRRR